MSRMTTPTPTPAPTAALLQSEIALLKAQRNHLLVVMSGIVNILANHPEAAKGNTTVHFAYYRALNAVHEVVEG